MQGSKGAREPHKKGFRDGSVPLQALFGVQKRPLGGSDSVEVVWCTDDHCPGGKGESSRLAGWGGNVEACGVGPGASLAVIEDSRSEVHDQGNERQARSEKEETEEPQSSCLTRVDSETSGLEYETLDGDRIAHLAALERMMVRMTGRDGQD